MYKIAYAFIRTRFHFTAQPTCTVTTVHAVHH